LTHEPLFQSSIRAAGLNPYLFEMANIRNQCSWVHSGEWDTATQKAKDLVRMAVARAAELMPLRTTETPVEKVALIIGGGAAGMSAALSLARQGFPVHLIERSDRLGGNLHNINYFLDEIMGGNGTKGPQDYLADLTGQVETQPSIAVHLQTELVETSGFKGNFVSKLRNASGTFEVRHGVTIVATGGVEYRGNEYGYGTDPRVVTQQEFEALLADSVPGNSLPDSVVMIQCIGPAEGYCGRICCTTALKNALVLKRLNPAADITIIYRDIRTYGFKERLYTQARREGVRFIRYDFDRKPEVTHADDGMSVRVREEILGVELELRPDLLILSTPVIPSEGAHELSNRLKVPVDMDGFFMEAHVKLRPVDFATDGVFMAGMAHYPKLIDETIVQAQAATARAATILSKEHLSVGGIVAEVAPDLCVGCLTCVRACPYSVPKISADLTGVGAIVGAAYINPAQCRGCGICAGECPAKAIQLAHYRDDQMEVKINAFFEPVVLA